MKVCPNNKKHKTFITVAHVAEDWEVDGEGNFIDTQGTVEVVAKPNEDNTWTCKTCGAEAVNSEN